MKKKPRKPPQVEAIAWAVPDELRGLTLYEADKKLCQRWPELLPAWTETYPSLDILTEIQRAHLWELEHPDRRKKDRPGYLGRWLRKEAARPPSPVNLEAERREREWERKSLEYGMSGTEDKLKAEGLI